MKRRTFLAGLAAIAVSSKLPPLPAPDVTPALPALPAKIPGVISTPSGWCAPSETIYEVARLRDEAMERIAAALDVPPELMKAGYVPHWQRWELPEIRVRRGGLAFGDSVRA